MKKLLKITFILSITTIILLSFAVPVNMPNGSWYQQFFPNLNGRVVSDITFADSLNGFAVTKYSSNDTNYILKTTNSGDNWSIVYRQFTSSVRPFNKVQFLNKDTGYAGGNRLLKTTNAGINWISLPLPPGSSAIGFYAVNEDSIWLADDLPFDGGLFRSTNKGISWVRQYDGGPAPNPDHVYMYNGRIGYMTRSGTYFYKTTNSGTSWFTIPGGVWRYLYFTDSLTGWMASYDNGNMKQTTDGGMNWIIQPLPTGTDITNGMLKFSALNRDTLFGVGGFIFYGAGRNRGILYKTTNGGSNWLYQVPDTSFGIIGYYGVQYLNNKIAWCFGNKPGFSNIANIHTTNGGDTTFLLGLHQISSEVPKEFMLFQNFPNPFNPKTNIKYNVKRETSNVKITVFDIQGKQAQEIVNQKQSAGTYEVDFSGNNVASGIYFYSLIIDGLVIDTKKMVLLK